MSGLLLEKCLFVFDLPSRYDKELVNEMTGFQPGVIRNRTTVTRMIIGGKSMLVARLYFENNNQVYSAHEFYQKSAVVMEGKGIAMEEKHILTNVGLSSGNGFDHFGAG